MGNRFHASEIAHVLVHESAAKALAACMGQWSKLRAGWVRQEQGSIIQRSLPAGSACPSDIERPEFQQILRRESAIEEFEREMAARTRWLREVSFHLFDSTLKGVLEQLPRPLPLSLDDLRERAWNVLEQATPASKPDIPTNAVAQFSSRLQGALRDDCRTSRTTPPFLVAEVHGEVGIDEIPEILWSAKHAAIRLDELRFVERHRRGRDFNFPYPQRLYAHVHGLFSERAVGAARNRAKFLVRACLTLAADVHQGFASRQSTEVVPSLEASTIKRSGDLLRDWIECAWGAVRPGQLQSRMQTAIHLYEEAHRQQHDAVAVALTFSAIEAVLGDRETSIGRMMSRRVPAILQPDQSARRELGKLIERLYDLRCDVIHGSDLTSPTVARVLVRIIFARLLYAAHRWIGLRREQNVDASERAFLAEVETAAEQGTSFRAGTSIEQQAMIQGFQA